MHCVNVIPYVCEAEPGFGVSPRGDTPGMHQLLSRIKRQLGRERAAGAAASDARPRWNSVSSCSEYERCPRRYRYGYVDRLAYDRPVPESWRYGTVVHRALEVAYRARGTGAALVTAEPEAIHALREAWLGESMPDDPDALARAERLVHETLVADRFGASETLGVEHRFRARVGKLPFSGFADLVVRRDARTVEIVDHKVTRWARTEEQLRGDPQLNLYGWFARLEWPWAERVVATHHYPLLQATVTVELTDASMTTAVEWLAELARRARADGVFAASPGPECANCPWAARCPEGRVAAA